MFTIAIVVILALTWPDLANLAAKAMGSENRFANRQGTRFSQFRADVQTLFSAVRFIVEFDQAPAMVLPVDTATNQPNPKLAMPTNAAPKVPTV